MPFCVSQVVATNEKMGMLLNKNILISCILYLIDSENGLGQPGPQALTQGAGILCLGGSDFGFFHILRYNNPSLTP